jgi:transposase
VIDPATKESQYFQSKPTAKALIRKLNEHRPEGKDLKICYEATYLGYSLCRELRKARFDCEVIAPSLIPELPGKKGKRTI